MRMFRVWYKFKGSEHFSWYNASSEKDARAAFKAHMGGCSCRIVRVEDPQGPKKTWAQKILSIF